MIGWGSVRRLRTLAVVAMLAPSFAGQGLSGQGLNGSVRGVVYDRDFEVPLPSARVLVLETEQETETDDQGLYSIEGVAPGSYTVLFLKSGYVREVQANVVVTGGSLTDVDASLSGDFTEMEEFVVQDLQLGAGTEASLLALRFESPQLLDSISADLLSRAGASDAAGALQLVSGASVQDGKFAVIRGLPDRYVSSQLNGVRLPSADENTRAVELDQFPAAVIDSVQVSKTFVPNQQGDSSGGAVDLRLKGVPEDTFWQFKAQYSYNTNVTGNSDFLTYDGGGVDFLGIDDGRRDVQTGNLGANWDGAVGVSEESAPIDFKWSGATGGRTELSNGMILGGFASVFYERDSSFFDDGIDDSKWVLNGEDTLSPEQRQGGDDDFKTALFDVVRGSQSVQWGGLAAAGLEGDRHSYGLTLLHTRTAEDRATLIEDTRGKEFFFPGYDPDDTSTPGHDKPLAAPYIRTETLEYTERTTTSLQLRGNHLLEFGSFGSTDSAWGEPELDWTLSRSFADLDQPDKRQFGSLWRAGQEFPGLSIPALHFPFKPAANFTLGNLQRIYKTIEEDSTQLSLNLKLPFEQWTDTPGFLQFGMFDDRVDRSFDQDTFSNFNDSGQFEGDFDDFWSQQFPFEDHPIQESLNDVDYEGDQNIQAFYGMLDLPINEQVKLTTGARFETTDIQTVNDAEVNATWFPPGSNSFTTLQPGDADVDFDREDFLPAVSLVYEPSEQWTFRAAYSETIARQTFKEITPIIQQEFLGGPIFIGNPELDMASLKNYDLRVDYEPYDGSLVSLSWFKKEIEDPIEAIQRLSAEFSYTTTVNYPEGELTGFELEVRQALGDLWDPLDGLSFGANATLIDSEVTLPEDDAELFETIGFPIRRRDATNAPEYLYNLYLTYDHLETGTQAGLFYTVKGDTLVAGAGTANGNFIPDQYEREVGTLNFSLSRQIGDRMKFEFKAKNLTDPRIRRVYRSDQISGGDVTRTSFTRGMEFSIGLSITN